MESDIQELINETTIIKVRDRRVMANDGKEQITIFWDKSITEDKSIFDLFASNISEDKYIFEDEEYKKGKYKNIGGRFQRDKLQGRKDKQIDLKELEDKWKDKWNSFDNNDNKWNKERQRCRFLLDSFKLFYFSFKQLNIAKWRLINETDITESQNLEQLAGIALCSMYYQGNKCIDLLNELNLIVDENDKKTTSEFKGTRNKLIEHNHNPKYKHNKDNKMFEILIDPQIWSLGRSEDSLLEIWIHIICKSENNEAKCEERIFDVYVDYYEDYYELEKIITDIIKRF